MGDKSGKKSKAKDDVDKYLHDAAGRRLAPARWRCFDAFTAAGRWALIR